MGQEIIRIATLQEEQVEPYPVWQPAFVSVHLCTATPRYFILLRPKAQRLVTSALPRSHDSPRKSEQVYAMHSVLTSAMGYMGYNGVEASKMTLLAS